MTSAYDKHVPPEGAERRWKGESFADVRNGFGQGIYSPKAETRADQRHLVSAEL